jgi:hypothetical protein
LFGTLTAIKDGDTTINEVFPTAASMAAAPKFGKTPGLFAAGTGAAKDESKPLPTTPSEDDKLVQLRNLMAESKVDESAIISILHQSGVESSLASLDDVNKISPETISDAITNWGAVAAAAAKLSKSDTKKSR